MTELEMIRRIAEAVALIAARCWPDMGTADSREVVDSMSEVMTECSALIQAHESEEYWRNQREQGDSI